MCYKVRIRKSGDHLNRLLRKLSLYVAIPSLMMTALSGCGSEDQASDDPHATPAAQLVKSDLQSLPNLSASGFQEFDARTEGRFTQVFGGNTAADLVNYLNTRLHYYLTPDDDAGIYPQKFDNDGWEKDEDGVANRHRLKEYSSLFGQEGGVVLGALNIGTEYWLDGLINNTKVTLRLGDQYIPVDSSLVGIVLLGEGYTDKLSDGHKHWVDQPAFVRQGILLHEARHSDCTGGVSEADLKIARAATSAQEFAKKSTMTACGHLHTFCPADMKPYENMPACDSEAWGAYSVEGMFLTAMSMGDLSEVDKNVAMATAIDRLSRVQVKITGDPDMSSSGYRP